MASAADIAAAQQVLSNLLRLQFLLTALVNAVPGATPTQGQIDVVIAAAGLVQVQPSPTYSADGVTYDWAGYLTTIGAEIDAQMKRIPLLQGPFEVRSYGR